MFNERKRMEAANGQPSQTSELRRSSVESIGATPAASGPVHSEPIQTPELRRSSVELGSREIEAASELAVDAEQPVRTSEPRRSSIESGTITVIRNFDINTLKRAERIDEPKPLSTSFGQGGVWFSGDGSIGFADFAKKFMPNEKEELEEWSRNREIEVDATKKNRRVVVKSEPESIETASEIDFTVEKEEEESDESDDEFYDTLSHSPYDPCVME